MMGAAQELFTLPVSQVLENLREDWAERLIGSGPSEVR